MTRGKQKALIFFSVLILGFSVQALMHFVFEMFDQNMWAAEISYFIDKDPRQFNFDGAYGNPGTPVLEIGTLLHTFFGVSYENAVALSVSVLVALVVAMCTVVSFVLAPHSLWWVATACTLLLNRLYIYATPPTAVAIPIATLIVLTAWWLIEQKPVPAMKYFLGWGAAVGLACATRIEVAMLVSAPLFLIILHRHARKTLLPIITGALVGFFLADPYLWRMPVQHLTDLVHRFAINYAQYQNMSLYIDDLIYTCGLAALCCAWCLALLVRRRLPRILPRTIIMYLAGISLLMLVVILSSNYKPARYFFPVVVVWEVILPLLVMDAVEAKMVLHTGPTNTRKISYLITALLAIIQFSGGLGSYLSIH